jgi:predicted nucleic acid-binding protein
VAPVALLVDAGPLYAAIDADDAHHPECLALLTGHPGPLAVPALVVAEVAWLVGTRLGPEAEVRFLGDLAARTLVTVPVEEDDWLRIAELVARYRNLPLGTVDASIVAAAERLGITALATLDWRHFGVVRPAHVAAFELVP